MSTIEHLEELLDLKNDTIKRLEEKASALEASLEATAWGWQQPHPVPENGLPLPRLELFARPNNKEMGYLSGHTWILRLVLADRDSEGVGLPIAAAKLHSMNPRTPDVRDHDRLPTRLHAEALFLAGHLGFPLYCTVMNTNAGGTYFETSFVEIDPAKGLPYDQGLKARKLMNPTK